MRLYLDTCCYNRPFDEQSSDRVRLETEAVERILDRARRGELTLVASEALAFEISLTPNMERMIFVLELYSLAGEVVLLDEDVRARARELNELGFKPFDALHLACAERGGADTVLSTDDRFLKRARDRADALGVSVQGPVDWIMERIR
jgi:predicted nucleic acid-binding protein